jgi:hypothetical protein
MRSRFRVAVPPRSHTCTKSASKFTLPPDVFQMYMSSSLGLSLSPAELEIVPGKLFPPCQPLHLIIHESIQCSSSWGFLGTHHLNNVMIDGKTLPIRRRIAHASTTRIHTLRAEPRQGMPQGTIASICQRPGLI